MANYRSVEAIRGKPHDFKICEECGRINWYEREYCLDCRGQTFNEDDNHKVVEQAMDYREQTGLTHMEV